MKARGIHWKQPFALITMTAILLALFPFPRLTWSAEAASASIVVDGDPSDWEGIPALSTNTGTAQILKASHDDKNLYLLVQGSGLALRWEASG